MKRPSTVEFSRKVKAAAFLRSGGKCEMCGLAFKAGSAEYDHALPAALGGAPTLANCRAICQPCHKAKTATDVRGIRKSDRQRDRASGAKTAKAKIPQPPKVEKQERRASLPPRQLYGDM